jgi:glutamate dehydrogenase (NAD(P)+)
MRPPGCRTGGGKVVLCGDPKMPKPDKERLIRALACSLRDVQEYIFAPDMGTDEECMAWVKDEIGRAVGLPTEVGGIPLDEIGATGWGLCHATEVALQYCGSLSVTSNSKRQGCQFRASERWVSMPPISLMRKTPS